MVSCYAQKHVYAPLRVHGYLFLDPVTALPSDPELLTIVNYNSQMLIYKATGWEELGTGTGGTGSGTVTSVNVSGGTTGLTFSGGPVTTSGTLTMAGTLDEANGGTGITTYTTGDIITAVGTTTLGKLSGVATGNALISGGIGAVPAWGKVGLTTHVSGTLPVANGGTGVTTSTGSGSIVMSNSPTITGSPSIQGYVPSSRTVNSKALTGDITITASDVGLGNVTNESKATMFTSPAFTGVPTVPTATLGTATTQAASTAFVANALAGYDPGDPANELSVDQLAAVQGATLPSATNVFTTMSNLTGYVPTSRTINGNALTGNISITATDVGLGNVTNESKATMFTNPTFTGTVTVPGYVPTSTTVNSKALTGNISITASDVGLGNVTNESKATMFTSPSLTGTPVAPTATAGTNTQQLSTTAFVQAALASLPQGVQILVTNEELTSGGESDYIFTITDQLNSWNLYKVEAKPAMIAGDHTMSVNVYRKRSGTEVAMTSAGASFTTDATINTSNDDLLDGDQLEFRWTFSGGSTAPTGLIVQLTFQKP